MYSFFHVGPKLPEYFPIYAAGMKMTTSPTGKGVIISGGPNSYSFTAQQKTRILIELSGDSLESLKWTILDQKLKYGRSGHVALSIPDAVCTDLIKKYK